MTIEEKGENSASVNRIEGTKRGHCNRNQSRGTTTGREKTCYRCGRTGHFGPDSNFPASGQFCHQCGLKGNFQEQCRTKQKGQEKQKQTKGRRNPKGGAANVVGCHNEEEEPVYPFTVRGRNEEKIEVTVGGCKLNMIIDSGASTNIIDQETWEWMKKNKVKCESARSSRKLYAYASSIRRTPFSMRSKLEEKIKELIELDIIEPAQGPTPWVNPIVVVPKSGGDIRLCIDMRRANQAIRRARHPIPTVDEITQSISAVSYTHLTLPTKRIV